MTSFQDLLQALERYWGSRGCVLQQPYDLEVGAGTMHPETFFRTLGPEPWCVAYCQPSRRPADGRFGENPMRVYKHYQYQVLLKPSPLDVQEQYLDSLRAFGVRPDEHDIRFEEDNWEAPTLGAAGVGWQVLMDGMEISQFTYFQQVGGRELAPISVELTYGIERICMFLNDIRNIFDIPWNERVSYGDVRRAEEIEHSTYSFAEADVATLRRHFDDWERDATRLLDRRAPDAAAESAPLVLPAYEATLRCSHLFNVLDARGALSVTERAASIARVRRLACRAADAFVAARERAGFPLLARARAQDGP